MNQYASFNKHNQNFNHKELSLNNYGRIKFSRNTILVVTEHKYHDEICLNAKLTSMMNLKINHVLMKQSTIKKVNEGVTCCPLNCTDLKFDDLLVIKNNKNIYSNYYYYEGCINKNLLLGDFHNYNRVDAEHSEFKTITIEYKDLWNIICLNIHGQKIVQNNDDRTLINIIPKILKMSNNSLKILSILLN